ncbi:hypothetical protein CLV59_103609 [Chitinophaga dinghuensis]|uniref:Uncharacterized protein n=1 Tax=Chitinophaga dinghuensis TaxID=1539050 RepID=A0A327WBX3_9BACT|nr:hypothetical protein [Chitinophaga dinghuensis]RAJ83638.1 hypothetical protein CLV59_103609 [Chitinophaga dinghuensis]
MFKSPNSPNRFLVIYSCITTVGLAMMLMAFKNVKESFDEISVKRINIVDEKGNNRIVISNEERTPPPMVGGKTFKRRFNPAGFIFYDESGNECGGLAMAKSEGSGFRVMAFDYDNNDAIGIITQEDLAGKNFSAGLMVNDKKPGAPVGSGVNRINLNTTNGVAGLQINGPDGKVRLRVMVDSLGTPYMETVDANGKIVKKVI